MTVITEVRQKEKGHETKRFVNEITAKAQRPTQISTSEREGKREQPFFRIFQRWQILEENPIPLSKQLENQKRLQQLIEKAVSQKLNPNMGL